MMGKSNAVVCFGKEGTKQKHKRERTLGFVMPTFFMTKACLIYVAIWNLVEEYLDILKNRDLSLLEPLRETSTSRHSYGI